MILPVAKRWGVGYAGVISFAFPLGGGKIKVSKLLKPVKQHLTNGQMPFDHCSGLMPRLGVKYMPSMLTNLVLAGPRAR